MQAPALAWPSSNKASSEWADEWELNPNWVQAVVFGSSCPPRRKTKRPTDRSPIFTAINSCLPASPGPAKPGDNKVLLSRVGTAPINPGTESDEEHPIGTQAVGAHDPLKGDTKMSHPCVARSQPAWINRSPAGYLK